MAVDTITRKSSTGLPWTSVVGFDVTEEDAERLVAEGVAQWGESYDPPQWLYVTRDILIRGRLFPSGTLVQTGADVTEVEALMLCFEFERLPGRVLANLPGGPVG